MSDKGIEEVMKQNYLRTVKELVCPGCDERLLRWPVRTCILGHGVCRLCRDQMKLCPVCNLPLVNEKSKVLDKFLKLLYHEYAKFKIDTRIKAAPTKVFASKPLMAPPNSVFRPRNRGPNYNHPIGLNACRPLNHGVCSCPVNLSSQPPPTVHADAVARIRKLD